MTLTNQDKRQPRGQLRVESLTEAQARDILTWRYPPPYDFYDPPGDDQGERYVRAFLDPVLAFHGVMDEAGEFLGFCSFGLDGQVPGGDYTLPALDIGLGMKPQFTGQGIGPYFFAAILAFASGIPGTATYRLSVARFNKRALRLYGQFGFLNAGEFVDTRFGIPYCILVRPA
ncbi:MAG: GNAT family N-acetyltransferase [Pseudomonadota bacterium]